MPVRSLRNSTRPPLSSRSTPGRSSGVAHDRAGARVRHQPAAAEDAAEAADLAHLVGHRDGGVELEPAALDLLHQIVDAGIVGAGLPRDPLGLARGEDEHAHDLAGAVRQHDRRADRLVGLARIDAEPGVNFDVSSKLAKAISLSSATASSGV